MECENRKQNEQGCTCGSTGCPRHGICCECIRYHRENGGTPGCLRK
ncbi:MAG: hypothetical protein ACLFSE_12330 [Spirochaetia bacterium]